MSHNCKNYTEQGGAVTHIGGKLIIEEGAEVLGLPSLENQEASTATTVAALKDDLNALIGKLKATGYMTADETEPESETNPESETDPESET